MAEKPLSRHDKFQSAYLQLDEEQVRKNLALRRKNERFLTVILEGSEYSGLKKVIKNLNLKGPKAQYQSPQKNYVSHKIF